MHTNKIIGGIITVLVLVGAAYLVSTAPRREVKDPATVAGMVTLTGTYECLPHLKTDGPQTMECAFGFKTDDGIHYAVNFGQSAKAAEQFRSGSHIVAEGFITPKETLNTDQWNVYNMKGIFTITRVVSDGQGAGSGATKLNIEVVCRSALSYMTFPDSRAAETFVTECKDGKHPEVIERFIKEMGADGKAI